MTKRKFSLKFIENNRIRRTTFKKRQAGFLKKLKELTILCDLDACAIIHGEEGTGPTVWPSPTVANDLILRFRNIPETERRRRMVNQQSYMLARTKKIQDEVLKYKKKNNQKDMNIFMHNIYDDGKSLCDFEVSDLRRLSCYVEEKLKDARKTIYRFEQSFTPNPPPPPQPSSCPLECGVLDDIDFWTKIDEQVSEQQWFLDLLEDVNQMYSGNDNNTTSNLGLPAYPDIGDIDTLLLSEDNFGGLSGESNSGVLPQGNFRGLNGETDSGLLHGNSTGEIGGNAIELPYENFGSTIGGSDMNDALQQLRRQRDLK